MPHTFFETPADIITMSSIFRNPMALRPLVAMRTCSSSSFRYSRPVFSPRWFSQSTKLCAAANQYTPEQLAAFKLTNHYAILGLDSNATSEDIKKAYRSLCKRFHPDMMRNIDSKEYLNDPNRPKFVQIKDSYELLIHPARRKEFDAVYDRMVQELTRLRAERRAAQGSHKQTLFKVASNLKLDQPTSLPDGSPSQNHCVAHVLFLPPHVTTVDLLRSVAGMGPVGRLIDIRLMPPSPRRVEQAAFLEFADDASAQRFGLLASNNEFIVLGKPIWHCQLVAPKIARGSRPLPPNATRVLVIDGPRDHKMMNVGALGELLNRRILGEASDSQRTIAGVTIQESCMVRESTNGPNSVTIEWAFTSWRRGANLAGAALRSDYPELRVSYGRDPCE